MSLLFDPPEPHFIGKTQCFATFLPFHAPGSSFFWLFLFSDLLSSTLLFSLTLPVSAFNLSILSEVWLLNFLRLWLWFMIDCIDLKHPIISYHILNQSLSADKQDQAIQKSQPSICCTAERRVHLPCRMMSTTWVRGLCGLLSQGIPPSHRHDTELMDGVRVVKGAAVEASPSCTMGVSSMESKPAIFTPRSKGVQMVMMLITISGDKLWMKRELCIIECINYYIGTQHIIYI